MKIGIAQDELREIEIEAPDLAAKGEELISKVCDMLGTMTDEFVVLKKTEGGFIAVPGRAIQLVEMDAKG